MKIIILKYDVGETEKNGDRRRSIKSHAWAWKYIKSKRLQSYDSLNRGKENRTQWTNSTGKLILDNSKQILVDGME